MPASISNTIDTNSRQPPTARRAPAPWDGRSAPARRPPAAVRRQVAGGGAALADEVGRRYISSMRRISRRSGCRATFDCPRPTSAGRYAVCGTSKTKCIWWQARCVLAVQKHRAAVTDEAGDGLDEARLAGAVGAEHDDLTLPTVTDAPRTSARRLVASLEAGYRERFRSCRASEMVSTRAGHGAVRRAFAEQLAARHDEDAMAEPRHHVYLLDQRKVMPRVDIADAVDDD